MPPHNNASSGEARTGAEHSCEPCAKRIKIYNDVIVGINLGKSQDVAER
jgi:hypothetical protein